MGGVIGNSTMIHLIIHAAPVVSTCRMCEIRSNMVQGM